MEKQSILIDNAAFIHDRNTIRDFVSRVRRVQYLANLSGVSKSTVERTFKVQNFESLSGNTLTVWENAVKLLDDFEALKTKTRDVADLIRKTQVDVSNG